MNHILSFLILISIVVFVHEFGHYFFARIFGVKITDFAIGFGKELFGITDKNSTRWKICLIPFGGYVKMFGDENVASFNKKSHKNASEELKKFSILYKKPYQKLLIAFGGPFFNFILAIILFFGLALFNGISHYKPIIEKITKNSTAEQNGFKIGDEILSINNKKIDDFRQIKRHIILSNSNKIEFLISRNGQMKNISISFNEKIKRTERLLGISSEKVEIEKVCPIGAIKYAINEFKEICQLTFSVIGKLINGSVGTETLGGPLSIAKESGEASKKGVLFFINFVSLISINLGLMNLLPIPLLDGGQIMISAIEMIIRRQLPEILNKFLYYFGITIIGILMFLGIASDIKGLF